MKSGKGRQVSNKETDPAMDLLAFGAHPDDLVVDISSEFKGKMEACRAYRSQMHDPRSRQPETRLSAPDFLPHIENIHRYDGHLIGARFGEAFYVRGPIGVDDLAGFFSGLSALR